MSQETESKPPVDEMMQLIRVQSLVRGFLERRKYRIRLMEIEGSSKYFKLEEAKETLTDNVYVDSEPLIQRKYKYTTGAVYDGTWKGGMRHGTGTMSWLGNARYIGGWQFNQACGQGKFIEERGDVYEGRWARNKANGFGTYTNMEGMRYEGNWKDDQQHGFGRETLANGAIYEGEYHLKFKEGHGKYT